MGALDVAAEGVGGEFDVLMAEGAGHFVEFGLAQDEGGLAAGAVDFAAEVFDVELDVDAAERAEHLEAGGDLEAAGFEPAPDQSGQAAGQEVVGNSFDEPSGEAMGEAEGVGQAADAGGPEVIMSEHEAVAVGQEVQGQPGEEGELEFQAFGEEADPGDGEFHGADQENDDPGGDGEEGVGEGRESGRVGGDEKSGQGGKEEQAARGLGVPANPFVFCGHGLGVNGRRRRNATGHQCGHGGRMFRPASGPRWGGCGNPRRCRGPGLFAGIPSFGDPGLRVRPG